jgi:Zn-dependent peptidase ImmA (M78 family)/DNA-binding XRE family transcriptional regulator
MQQTYPIAGSGQFVPARLQIARQARGMKQNELAKLISRGSAMISKWESDAYDSAPDTTAILALSTTLRVSSGWFYKPVNSELSYPFFRSMKTELNRARDQLAARLTFLDAIHEALVERVEFPDLDIPDLMGSQDFRLLRNEEIDRIARQAREFWSLADDPIDDLLLVIENAGVIVGEDIVNSAKLDGVSSWSTRGAPLILLAKDKNVGVRRRFDAAHELGHLILHRGLNAKDFEANFRLIEEQAMSFAGAFLLPASSFSSDIRDTSLDELADKKLKWRVSIGAMIKRLEFLNLISSDYARNLWKYYSYRQWRGCEPFDDTIEIERPINVKAAIELVASDGQREAADLLKDIGLLPNDIHELTDVDQCLLEYAGREKPRLKLVKTRTEKLSEAAND